MLEDGGVVGPEGFAEFKLSKGEFEGLEGKGEFFGLIFGDYIFFVDFHWYESL